MGERCNGVTVCEGLDAYPGLTSGGNIIHIMYSYQYRFDSFSNMKYGCVICEVSGTAERILKWGG